MKSEPVLPQRSEIYAARAWLAVCLLLMLALVWLLPRSHINSSVLALLPQQNLGQAPAEIQQGFMQRLDRQLVWLVTAPGADGDAAAAWWQAQLQALPMLSEVSGALDEHQLQRWGSFAYQHRNGLIDPLTRARLQHGGGAQADWILAQLFSAFAGVSSKELAGDPLLLVRGAQLALQQNASKMVLHNGWLTVSDAQQRRWYFLHGELVHNAFSMAQSHQLVSALQQLEQQLKQRWPQAQLLTRGTVLFSDDASQRAQHDVATLGSVTLGGLLLLVWLVFRSLRPLALSALSVAIGAMAGTVVTLLFFGELHLTTLVMSLSIVGISADYTLYYLTERMVHGEHATPWQSLHKVRGTLLLALGTTAIAWLLMLLAPFPGLRQLAVFAASGLSAACLTVICFYPWLVRGLPVRPVPAMVWLARWLAAWRRQRGLRVGLPLLVALYALSGILQLRIDDNIAHLQSAPAQLLAQDRQLAQLTGQQADQTWFVVWGDNEQQVLQRLNALAPGLQHAQQQGWLASYRLLPLSTLAQQQQDVALLQQAAPTILARLQQAGISLAQASLQPMPVSVQAWLASPLSEGWRLLWLSLPDGRSSVLVPVSGVTNSAALQKLATPQAGVSWVDRKARYDELFGFWRTLLSGLLALALLLITVSYTLRLGLKAGLRSALPSWLSLAAALATLGWLGASLNLFALLALILVLGIGINYTLFFSNPRGTPLTSMLAVTLAMMTTLLTLGMLVFSSTSAISSFGTVLCSGIFCAFLLAPLALAGGKRKPR
ncbi:MMPL family transporter [Pantoea dispersa]|uniref:MMPL family transporter n=1 Tax=Pantoea dispersa TaxID=59814 RepID=UPI002DB743DD|nr:MMPL family transporter [Pantoea dispersa]MEB5970867.1 MMPL family transporter [Pantoea dispersa]